MKRINKITILGDGGWGTTLAILLARKGFKVYLWGAFKENVSAILRKRVNQKFLPGIKLPLSVEVVDDLPLAISGANLIVLAIPSQFIRQILRRIKKLGITGIPFLSVTKGIETKSLMRISEVIQDELGENIKLAVLSGSTIALEVARGIPTACVISAYDKALAKSLQEIFTTDRFKVYTNTDMVGVELGGSLKNIIAIACGISDGLGFGANTKAAILARGLAEISRIGIVMGAKKETFSGISGLGDLVTTCISRYSRNRFVGEQVGKGKRLKEVLAQMDMVAEGVPAARAGHCLSRKYRVPMPITEQVYEVLYQNKNPLKAVSDLMARKSKEE